MSRAPFTAPVVRCLMAGLLVGTPAAPVWAADGARTDLQQGDVHQRVGAYEITLALTPRPVRPMQAQTMTVRVRASGRPINNAAVSASLSMVGMDMGPNRPVLKPIGRGEYQGQAVFPACHSGSLDWSIAVTVESGGQRRTATFPVRLAPGH
jgi:hypothetical protein